MNRAGGGCWFEKRVFLSLIFLFSYISLINVFSLVLLGTLTNDKVISAFVNLSYNIAFITFFGFLIFVFLIPLILSLGITNLIVQYLLIIFDIEMFNDEGEI